MPLSLELFSYGGQVNISWVELAEQLKFLDESRAKISALEQSMSEQDENLAGKLQTIKA